MSVQQIKPKHKKGEACLICGAPLIYFTQTREMECSLCHRTFLSSATCEAGHFICDECHSAAALLEIRDFCLKSDSINPFFIAEALMCSPTVHMHGPEHHVLVGAALLTACYRAERREDLNLALDEMITRGSDIPGGICGFWGCCGAAVSAGIFASIYTKATPLSDTAWGLSNRMTAACLNEIGIIGGPRCCKRDSFISLRTAVSFIKENFHITLEFPKRPTCQFSAFNRQCIGMRCPFHCVSCSQPIDFESAQAPPAEPAPPLQNPC